MLIWDKILREVQELRHDDQARLAAEILNRLGLDRMTIRTFLSTLDQSSAEALWDYEFNEFLG